ncbi:MAG: HEPN domain-containing protein [Nitrospirota bacterium]
MKKALFDIEAARWAFSKSAYDVCARASYYAVFHAEIAALIQLAGVKREFWNHDFVQSEFAQILIHSKKMFSESLANIAPYLIGYRHKADYHSELTGKKVAERCLQKAEILVSGISEKIGDLL